MRLLTPQRMRKRQIIFFYDSTERPIQRPKDRETQKAHYSGKKKQHTVKNNILINTDSKVVFLTPSYGGRIHDEHIADITGYSPPPGSILYQDTGFQGFTCPQVKMIQSKKRFPKGGELTAEEKAMNREISSIRIRVEHAISGIKRYRIVKDMKCQRLLGPKFRKVKTSFVLNLLICKVVVEGRPSTTPSKPCVRLSPHMAFPLSVAIDALGQRPPLLYFLFISHLTSIVCMLSQDFKSIDKMFSEMFQSTQPDYASLLREFLISSTL